MRCVQELAETLGLVNLNKRLNDPSCQVRALAPLLSCCLQQSGAAPRWRASAVHQGLSPAGGVATMPVLLCCQSVQHEANLPCYVPSPPPNTGLV